MVRPRVRQQILSAATKLLKEQGLSALTTRNLARAAGVTQASVFNNFGDKAGLLHALLLELPENQRLAERLQALKTCEPDVWLGAAFEILCEFFSECLPLSLPVYEAGGSDEARALLGQVHEELARVLERQCRSCHSWPRELGCDQVEPLLSQALLAAYSQLLAGRKQNYQQVARQWLARTDAPALQHL